MSNEAPAAITTTATTIEMSRTPWPLEAVGAGVAGSVGMGRGGLDCLPVLLADGLGRCVAVLREDGVGEADALWLAAGE